ncbi:MAG: TolC family protein [Raineya sp.]|jgi:outer membrane protein TolC|nr:TolC family protein [Raineya sp.]
MRLFFITLFLLETFSAFAQKSFSSLDALLAYTQEKSITLESNKIRLEQAQKAKLAAILGTIDPVANINGSFTDNTRLPVNLFPAEAFGGQAGTYRQVQTGVKYTTATTQNIDIKLINPAGWENLKLAEINIELTESNNQVTLKTLQENIAISYFNIIMLQEQLKSTQRNLAVADTLYQTAKNKYDLGLVKQQDVNDTKVNYLNTQENIKQIEFLIKQHYIILKTLCDIPDNEEIEIKQDIDIQTVSRPNIELNSLQISNSVLKEQYAWSNFNQTRKMSLPTLSFVASNSYQLFNTEFKMFNGNWINSNYIGLKLTFALPNATLIANRTQASYNYKLTKKSTEQAKIKADLEVKQLANDFDKASSQTSANKEIYGLRMDTYQKNKNLYSQGLMSLDQILNSFNAMVNAEYSLISSKINILLAQAKIDIHNKVK